MSRIWFLCCISCCTRDFYFQCHTVMRDAFVEKCFEPCSLGHWANAQENHFYSLLLSNTQKEIVAVDGQVAPVLIEVKNICFSASVPQFLSPPLCV